jgi:hypothetical protein
MRKAPKKGHFKSFFVFLDRIITIFRIILERQCFKAICGGSSEVKISRLVFTHDESSAWGQMNTIWTHHFVMALKQHNYAFKNPVNPVDLV